ncbi:transposase [Cyanosarcina cf. burmensis CCALA 770]|nr:transposase [Cyanosarcina cf. burmensis CCALA 770]
MLLTQTVRLKLDESSQEILKTLCHLSKNLFNVGLYTVRQYFFQERKYLSYESAYHLCKQNENYQSLATDCGQQTLKYVDRCFKAFFKLLSMRQEGGYARLVQIPKYLPKDGFFPLVIPIRARHDFAAYDWKFLIPTSRQFRRDNGSIYITVPENIRQFRIKEIRILPKQRGHFFDAAFVYERQDEKVKNNFNNAIGIDFGLDNLATVVSTTGESFIIDGKHLKSVNQWFNKRISHLRSHKDKQGIKGLTDGEAWLSYRRSNQVRDYLSKSARYIIDFCIQRQIGTVVVGYNPTLKQGINLGTRNNQNFTQIPIFTLRAKLESLCARYGINYVEQEESYTSQSSFLDNDPLPIYNADNPTAVKFSGKRIKRGLYRTKRGHLISSDTNGAANILRKSNNELDFQRVDRVCLTQPVRVRILRESPTTAAA